MSKDLERVKNISREWMEEFAAECSMTFEQVIAAGDEYLETGEYHTLSFDTPSMAHGPEYWEHYEIITGRKFMPAGWDKNYFKDMSAPIREASAPFSCAC